MQQNRTLACRRPSNKVTFTNKQELCYYYAEEAPSPASDEIIDLDDTFKPSLSMPELKKTLAFASTLCYKIDQLSEKHDCGFRFDERLISKCNELWQVMGRGGSCDALQVLAEDILAMQRLATPRSHQTLNTRLLDQQPFSYNQQISGMTSSQPPIIEEPTESVHEVVGRTVRALREVCGLCPPGYILYISEMTKALKEACLDNQHKTIASVSQQININIINMIQQCKLDATSNQSYY